MVSINALSKTIFPCVLRPLLKEKWFEKYGGQGFLTVDEWRNSIMEKKVLAPVIIASVIIYFLLIHFSCSPGGPLTPRRAYSGAAIALKRGNVSALYLLLSTKSRQSIEKMAAILNSMPPEQKRSVLNYLGFKKDKNRVSAHDLLKRHMYDPRSLLHTCFSKAIVAEERNDDEAIFKSEDGTVIRFVREGPYWYLDADIL